MVYKAAAEVKSTDEAQKFKLETMVIPKGNYIAETIHNFKKDPLLIGKTFQKLMTHRSLDPQGYSVEWYLPNNQDVFCMIRVKERLAYEATQTMHLTTLLNPATGQHRICINKKLCTIRHKKRTMPNPCISVVNK